MLFAVIKGVPRGKVNAEVDRRLELAGLTSVGLSKVGSFSGGMKRRLSVALATIGDPKVQSIQCFFVVLFIVLI